MFARPCSAEACQPRIVTDALVMEVALLDRAFQELLKK